MSIEKSNDIIGNRTRVLSARSIVPQPITLPRAAIRQTAAKYYLDYNYFISKNTFTYIKVQITNSFKLLLQKHITNSMDPSPSWKATCCAPTQVFRNIIWNPKVQHRVHKSPPLVPILSQINLVHITPSLLSKIYLNIIHPPISSSS
jgi:hypothetical protein